MKPSRQIVETVQRIAGLETPTTQCVFAGLGCNVPYSSVTRRLRRAEELGLVTRVPARGNIPHSFQLTEQGRALVSQVSP